MQLTSCANFHSLLSYNKLESRDHSKESSKSICNYVNNTCKNPLEETFSIKVNNQKRSSSKAYTDAMKALQKRIKELEIEKSDNENILDKIIKIIKELNKYEGVNKNNKYLCIGNNINSKKLLQEKMETLNEEKKKLSLQYEEEREQWKKEKIMLMNRMNEISENERKLADQKDIIMDEVRKSRKSLANIKKLYNKSKKAADKEIEILKVSNVEYKDQLHDINNKRKKIKHNNSDYGCFKHTLAIKSNLKGKKAFRNKALSSKNEKLKELSKKPSNSNSMERFGSMSLDGISNISHEDITKIINNDSEILCPWIDNIPNNKDEEDRKSVV